MVKIDNRIKPDPILNKILKLDKLTKNAEILDKIFN